MTKTELIESKDWINHWRIIELVYETQEKRRIAQEQKLAICGSIIGRRTQVALEFLKHLSQAPITARDRVRKEKELVLASLPSYSDWHRTPIFISGTSVADESISIERGNEILSEIDYKQDWILRQLNGNGLRPVDIHAELETLAQQPQSYREPQSYQHQKGNRILTQQRSHKKPPIQQQRMLRKIGRGR
ncbi:hypothetical protein fHeYen902_295 [Yersinia phage fHe-Yen9-02]|nr:hypothetical protein fHeYen902_295 [Yersinia phage fHe-Yen9-02]